MVSGTLVGRSRLENVWGVGGSAIGGWLSLGSPAVSEIVASEALDYVVADCQHGLIGYDRMVEILSVIGRMAPVPMVRVPSLDSGWVGRALDAGAEGIIIPLVSSRQEAEAAAASCRYPPLGARSMGPIRGSTHLGVGTTSVNEAVLCIVMIETRAGLESVADICSVPGVNGVYIGPSDLSLGLGLERTPTAPDPPELTEAIEHIRDECLRQDVVPGIHAANGQKARTYLEQGFRMVTTINDVNALRWGLAKEVTVARGVSDGQT